MLDFLAALPAYQDALAEIYTVSLDSSNTPVYSSQIAFCGEQCAVAHLARDAAGSGTVTVDHRQRLFGSLLWADDRVACPGDCGRGRFRFLCACLTCGAGGRSCAGNAALDTVPRVFRLDPATCRVERVLADDHHGPLEALPFSWHANGPGKVSYDALVRAGLWTCLIGGCAELDAGPPGLAPGGWRTFRDALQLFLDRFEVGETSFRRALPAFEKCSTTLRSIMCDSGPSSA